MHPSVPMALKTEPSPGARVTLVWRDAVTHPGWCSDPQGLQYLVLRTTGFWVGMDASSAKVACTVEIDEDRNPCQWADVSVIPLACILTAEVHEH